MSAALIQPAEVVRDEFGWWSYPDMPEFDGDEDIVPRDVWQAWLDSQNCECCRVDFEYDAPEELQERWMENGEVICHEWQPSVPDGEGWFMLGIWDTEDGPVCWWLRRKESQA